MGGVLGRGVLTEREIQVNAHRFAVVLVVALASFAAGCSTAPRSSGFLGDTTQLTANPDHPGTWRWIKPGLDLRTYDKVMIDPVDLRLKGSSVANSLHDDSQARYAAEFTEVIRAKLAPFYDLVDAPGPGTLRLRIALTDMLLGPDGIEDSSLEAELLDAQSGERLVAAIATNANRPREGVFQHWATRILDFLESRGVEGK
jgi:hypothetical protein